MPCGCNKTSLPSKDAAPSPETDENRLRREQRQIALREERAAAWRKRRGLE